jgi:hypothetical protein
MISNSLPNVCFWHKADIQASSSNVRFWGESGHQQAAIRRPLLTQADMGGSGLFAVQTDP